MKISELSHLALRALLLASALFIAPIHRAQAFGVIGTSAGEKLEQTGEQVILVDNPDATVTAVIQLELSGDATELSWVIPVPAEPTLNLSSSAVFQRLSGLTAPQYWVELTDPCTVRGPDHAVQEEEEFADTQTTDAEESPARVKLVEQNALDPYEHNTLRIDAAGGDVTQAISAALTERGFAWDDRDSELLTPYVEAGMGLLAIKLKNPTGQAAITRPIAITYDSSELSIPIRATRARARDDMPLRIWLFGDAHAVPANFQTLIVNDALYDWQSAQKFPFGTAPANGAGSFGPRINLPTNYEAVVAHAAGAAQDGQGFLVEHSAPSSHVRDIVWAGLDSQNVEYVTELGIDGFEAISRALQSFRGWDGLRAVIEHNVELPRDASLEQLLMEPAAFRDSAQIDAERFVEQLEREVVAPVRDTAERMRRTPYMTQLFTTLSAPEMTLDPTFEWNPDLALVSNVHIAKQYLMCEPGEDAKTAAWRMELPQGGVVVGAGRDGWPITLDAMPANLKVVALSTQGPGEVVQDNRAEIGRAMYEAAGRNGTGVAIPLVPQNGLAIGSDQTVIPHVGEGRGLARSANTAAAGGCSAAGAPAGGSAGALVWLAGALYLLRRRRTQTTRLAPHLLRRRQPQTALVAPRPIRRQSRQAAETALRVLCKPRRARPRGPRHPPVTSATTSSP